MHGQNFSGAAKNSSSEDSTPESETQVTSENNAYQIHQQSSDGTTAHSCVNETSIATTDRTRRHSRVGNPGSPYRKSMVLFLGERALVSNNNNTDHDHYHLNSTFDQNMGVGSPASSAMPNVPDVTGNQFTTYINSQQC